MKESTFYSPAQLSGGLNVLANSKGTFKTTAAVYTATKIASSTKYFHQDLANQSEGQENHDRRFTSPETGTRWAHLGFLAVSPRFQAARLGRAVHRQARARDVC